MTATRPAAAHKAWRAVADGVMIRVRLTPRSSREGVEGLEATAQGPAVKARVRAAPEQGAANSALVALIARWLAVPQSMVAVVAGTTARVKSVHVAGQPAALGRRIDEAVAGLAAPHARGVT